MPKMARFEIRKGRTGKFRFVLVAANGEPIATSEHYKTKGACKKGIDAVLGAINSHYGDPDIVDKTVKAK